MKRRPPTTGRLDRKWRRIPKPATLLLCGLAPLAVLWILCRLDIPLGQPDYLIYRYSPQAILRLIRCSPVWALALGLIWVEAQLAGWRFRDLLEGAWESEPAARDAAPRRTTAMVPNPRRGALRALRAGLLGLLVLWTWIAPPRFIAQHIFNLQSPAQDGAFVWEAREVQSVRAYLATGFLQRLQLDPRELRGTRVLSNPPGTTLLAVGVQRLLRASPGLAAAADATMDWFEEAHQDWSEDFRVSLVLGLVLTALWGCALIPMYAAARLWLPAAPALAMALACVWNPSTVNFTPGKDPAQLLCVGLLLYAGLRAYLRRSAAWAAGCGAALSFSLIVGLIHAWIALILLIATGVHAARVRRELRGWLRGVVAPAAAGTLAGWLLILLLSDYDVMRGAWHVARRYPEIQKYLVHGAYTLAGFPIFLLFAGPTFWVLTTGLRPDPGPGDEIGALGAHLSWTAGGCMVYCYFFANNNEIARLWTPFLALLTLTLSMRRRAALAGDTSYGAGSVRGGRTETSTPVRSVQSMRVVALLLAMQIIGTALHWTMMDAREAEHRLLEGIHWGSAAPRS